MGAVLPVPLNAPVWLEVGLHDAVLARIRAAKPRPRRHPAPLRHPPGPLGPALDGPGTLADAAVWYFILGGTCERSVAEAQATALTELVAHPATSPGTGGQSILLVAQWNKGTASLSNGRIKATVPGSICA